MEETPEWGNCIVGRHYINGVIVSHEIVSIPYYTDITVCLRPPTLQLLFTAKFWEQLN